MRPDQTAGATDGEDAPLISSCAEALPADLEPWFHEPVIGVTASATVNLVGDQSATYPGPGPVLVDDEANNLGLFGLVDYSAGGIAVRARVAGLFRVSFYCNATASADSRLLVSILKGDPGVFLGKTVLTMTAGEVREVRTDRLVRLAANEAVNVTVRQTEPAGDVRIWSGAQLPADARVVSGLHVEQVSVLTRTEGCHQVRVHLGNSESVNGYHPFDVPFAQPPRVQLAITGWDDLTTGHGRVELTGVTREGFSYEASRSPNRLDDLFFSWTAIGT